MRTTALAEGTYYGRPLAERRIAGLRLCRSVYAPRARLPAHAHDSAYLCLALSGSFRERSGGRESEVVAGSVVLHQPGESHADSFGDEPALCLNVAFSPRWCGLDEDWLTESGAARYASPAAVGTLAQRLALEFERLDQASGLALSGLTLELLSVFARDARSPVRQPPRWLDEVLARLREPEPVPLGELARTAGVHPATLARVFRRLHGCSLGEYRRRWRLERALTALRTEDAPLSEVAARFGFADQSHLTRALRAAVGMPPGAYRRAVRRN